MQFLRRPSNVITIAILLGLGFWVFDALILYYYFRPYFLRIIIFEKPETLMDALLLNLSTYTWFIRLLVMAICLAGGLLMMEYIRRQRAIEVKLQDKTRQQQKLFEAAHQLTSSLEVNEVLTRIGQGAQEILDAYGCTIYFLNEDGLTLEPIIALDPEYAAEILAVKVNVNNSLTGKAVLARRAMVFNDSLANPDAYYVPGTPKDMNEHLIVAPFVTAQQVLGAIVLSRVAVEFSEDELALVQAFATYATTALQNAWSHRDLSLAEARLREERARLSQRVADRTAELQATNAELTRAVRAKDEFLATMSHELRTPLTAILAFAQMLRDGVYGAVNERQVRPLQGIMDSGHHLLDLITDILDITKIESGKLELNLFPVDVPQVCESSIGMIRQSARQKGLKISTTIDHNITFIKADERRLKQMLVNLLDNAVKFTPEGGTIGLEVTGDQEAPIVRFTVWDTGIGIAEDNIPRLFKPFVQLDTRLSREYEGTGLGLSLVYRLAEMHGGSIKLESEVDVGSRFTISLPWQSMDQAQVPEKTAPAYAEQRSTEMLDIVGDWQKDVTILIAEDNRPTQQFMADYLTARGFNILVAYDGVDACSRTRSEHPDLIIMDIQMPRMDGLDATRSIRTVPELVDIPVIALTALTMPGDRERCLAAGVDAYLSKPVNLPELCQTIRSLLVKAKVIPLVEQPCE